MDEQLKQLTGLIATANPQNIELALQLVKGNIDLQKLAEERYMPVIGHFKGKTLKMLKTLHHQFAEYAKTTESHRLLLKDIPTELLGEITKINWNKTSVDKLPDYIGTLEKLKFLMLGFCRFKEFPNLVTDLKALQHLELHHNNIRTLPAGIANLKMLNYLRLDVNPLQEIPCETGELISLEYLNLEDCQLRTIPDIFQHLSSLIVLVLGKNNLNKLPESIGRSPLQRLYLQQNKFSEFPSALLGCTQLKELDLSNNLLTSITTEIGQLTKLSYLNLKGNPLEEDAIFEIRELLPNCEVIWG